MAATVEDELLKQGAEAKVYKCFYNGQVVVRKERLAKPWRHAELDAKLRKTRLKQESNCMMKARDALISVPKVIHIDRVNFHLVMEYIEGTTLREKLQSNTWNSEQTNLILGRIGRLIASLHNIDVVHEDLTTSNILVRKDTDELVLIDFGLSHVSYSNEDKAVDLYVLERAFLSTHPELKQEFEYIMEGYFSTTTKRDLIFTKLSDVRARGRKRTMIG